MGQRLGQHFLIHSWAARALAHAAAPQGEEVTVEIGPGKGVLTKELLALGPVVAIEKDEQLVALLKQTFAEDITAGKLRLIEGDVRDVTPQNLGVSEYVVAANIPYYITGEIIRQFLSADPQPRCMALLIQKEVAQRIVSEKGSILSMSVKAYGVPRIVEKVSKKHFSPPPAVDSAILAVDHISKKFFSDLSEELFFRVVKSGFASKRKFVSNNLSVVFNKEMVAAALKAAGAHDKARAEDLTLEQWKSIAKDLAST